MEGRPISRRDRGGPETTALVRVVIVVALLLTACSGSLPAPDTTSIPATSIPATTTTTAPATTTTTTTTTTLPAGVTLPPDWLGTRPLPQDADGRPQVLPTPAELIDRRFATTSSLATWPDDVFRSTIEPVPPDVAARSTWQPDCPVGLEDLAYLTLSFWGFDGLHHTGELIVHRSVADDVVEVFARIFAARFPIEEMGISTIDDLDAEPTGDGNKTEGFVCRPVVGATTWSQHALGLAIDINPFQNPYLRGDVVIPELASAYLDRQRQLPGMITEGDAVTAAFDSIGWGWGGRWNTLKDWHHFSRDNR